MGKENPGEQDRGRSGGQKELEGVHKVLIQGVSRRLEAKTGSGADPGDPVGAWKSGRRSQKFSTGPLDRLLTPVKQY
jgi:hypothetical protein